MLSLLLQYTDEEFMHTECGKLVAECAMWSRCREVAQIVEPYRNLPIPEHRLTKRSSHHPQR